MGFNKNGWWRFQGKKGEYEERDRSKIIRYEVVGPSYHPGFIISMSPWGEDELMIHFSLGVSVYISFEGFLPKWIKPKDDRELSLRFHNGSIWCNLWMNPDEWNSTDPKWRRWSFNFADFFLGRVDAKQEKVDTAYRMIELVEGAYTVRVDIFYCERWRKRFYRESYYRLKCTPVKKLNGEWVDTFIPIEGKGENSWDCGEAGRYSSSFHEDRVDSNLGLIDGAVKYFAESIVSDRIKYGGKDWYPKNTDNITI